ncbi:MAG: DUF4397 domain-containing protein [Pseudomonadota bacterium]
MFQIKPLYAAVASCALLLAACDDSATVGTTNNAAVTGSSGSSADIGTNASIRVVHASPDAPAVNVALNGATAIEALDYGESSGFATVPAGAYDVAVDGILPAGTATVISVDGLTLPAGSKTTVVAVGDVAEIAPLVVPNSASTPAASEITLTVTHAAPAAPTVQLYLLAPNAPLDLNAPGAEVAFQQTLDLGALPAGEVRIIAAAGGAVAFDSGTVDLAPFAGNALSVFAIESDSFAEQTGSPIKLLVGTGSATVTLRNTMSPAAARVVHVSPDARVAAHGPVEVWATPLPDSHPIELIDAFSYTDVVPSVDSYVTVPAGGYRFDVAPDTDTIGDSVFTSGDLDLAAGSDYSVLAVGRVTNTDPANAFRLIAFEDENRPVATQASLRVVHGAPAAGTVDVYVSAAGEVNAHALDTIDPVLSGFAFGDVTDALALTPGSYDVRVVAGGAVAINAEGVQLAAGSVSTAIARGPIEGVHVAPQDFGLILLSR